MSHAPLPSLHGVWQIVRAELGGQPMPADAAEQVEFEITGDTYTVRFGVEATDHGTYELRHATPHLHIALTGKKGVNEGRTIHGIFQNVGDRLRICYALEAAHPPTQFAAPPGTLHYLVTYRRKA